MSDEPKSVSSYREAPLESRYLCIACFAWAAPGPGTCGKCGAPLHDITDPEVLQAMHEEANRRLRRQQQREYFWFTSSWVVTGLVLNVWIVGLLAWTIATAVSVTGFLLYPRLRPGKSAITTLNARVFRKQAMKKPEDEVPILTSVPPEDPDGVPDGRMARFAGPDPDLLDGAGLVKWFGARLHD